MSQLLCNLVLNITFTNKKKLSPKPYDGPKRRVLQFSTICDKHQALNKFFVWNSYGDSKIQTRTPRSLPSRTPRIRILPSTETEFTHKL
jgi:hypothetical protein